jgi:glycosyltransferase involved in cell wall biosynthesis
VARALRRELGGRAAPVCLDPYEGAWRPLEAWELGNLDAPGASGARGARWPLAARVRGRLRRWRRRPELAPTPGASGVLVPEIFSPEVAASLPALFAAAPGPRVAIFHDAIALRMPELAPPATVARFPAYLRELLLFDGVAAVSEDSRASLADYWAWLGAARTPALTAIPLGIDPVTEAAAPPAPPVPTILCVGSIEGRKNHAALLDACEALWARGARFELRLIGLANRQTGAAALERIERLRAQGRAIRYDGAVGDDALDDAYARCSFTVYPSLAEGFGLPVAESLARGRACLCRTSGALGEVASGGGCLGIGAAGASDISEAMARLLSAPGELAALTAQAGGRRFKTWADYTGALLGWMSALGRDA